MAYHFFVRFGSALVRSLGSLKSINWNKIDQAAIRRLARFEGASGSRACGGGPEMPDLQVTARGERWGSNQTLDRIGRREIEAFIAHMDRSGRAPKTTLNALGILHSIFEYARREEWVLSNPCTLVEKPRATEGDPDIRFLEPEEVEALLRGVPDDDLGRVERRMYLAAAMTGMRQGELLALRWRDIDWPARACASAAASSAASSARPSPSAPRAASRSPTGSPASSTACTRETPYRHDDELVFAHPHTGKPIDRSRLLKRFKAALHGEASRPVRFHDLRHTFGTRMAAQGVPMRALQEMMGHRDFKTTLIYADYAPSAREAEWVEAAFRTGQRRPRRGRSCPAVGR